MSEKGSICFVDSRGKALFWIPDGGMIKQCFGNGDEHYAICRRLDHENTEIDGRQWNNRQFVEKMEQNGICFFPV